VRALLAVDPQTLDIVRDLSVFVSNPDGADKRVQASLPGALRRDRPPGRIPPR
jgi:hypothetical protein